jgi:hypothetical protein
LSVFAVRQGEIAALHKTALLFMIGETFRPVVRTGYKDLRIDHQGAGAGGR